MGSVSTTSSSTKFGSVTERARVVGSIDDAVLGHQSWFSTALRGIRLLEALLVHKHHTLAVVVQVLHLALRISTSGNTSPALSVRSGMLSLAGS
jgi:hypothetical protein